MALNVDDPGTWDGASFLELAEAGLAASPEPQGAPTDEAPIAIPDPQAPEAKPEPEAPTGVLSKDGAHVIPYQELADTRARLAEEREARQSLETRLKALEETSRAAAQGVPDPAPGQDGALDWPGRAEALARLENARAVGDEDLTQALGMALASRDQVEAQARDQRALLERLERMEAGNAGLAQRQQAVEQAEREAAFEGNAFLKELYDQAQAGRPGMWNAALATASQWGADPQWQAMNWGQRFAAVETEIRAQFGIAEPTPAAAPSPKPAPTRVTDSGVPPSMSHIPGGEPRDPLPRTAADLAGLSGKAQTEHMVALYQQGKFFDFLDAFPVGSLNVGDRA